MIIIEDGTMSTFLGGMGAVFGFAGVINWYLVYKGILVNCPFEGIDSKSERYGPKAERVSAAFVETIRVTTDMLAKDKYILSTQYVNMMREDNK